MRASRVCVALCAMLPALSMAQAWKKDAAEYLMRSMQREFPTNVVTILLQRNPGPSDSFLRVKVERNKDGQERQTILQPLRLQGYTMVDNGDRLRTYVPDQRIILDQDSPSKTPCQAAQRMKLARKNYSFRFASSDKIAGRDTVCVVATPRYGELDVRKYYLDAATAYPLRHETYSSGQEVNVIFNTKDIQFPATMPKQLFTLDTRSDVKLVKYNRPKKIVSSSQARSLVGFTPLVPQGLPMGFEVQEVQYNDSDKMKSIVVRLSDGLARATVYQTSAEGQLASLEDSTVRLHGGVRLMIVSDLSPRVRAQLLNAFISHATSEPALRAERIFNMLMPLDMGLQASVELVNSVWAFAGIDSMGRDGISGHINGSGQ